jgi:uncharacterized protein RhaS with RHS repeats
LVLDTSQARIGFLSTTTFTYDNNGNVTQKTVDGTTTTYVYDYANRLTALGVGGATTSYAYDWQGNRVSQTGTSTTWLYPCTPRKASPTSPSDRISCRVRAHHDVPMSELLGGQL